MRGGLGVIIIIIPANCYRVLTGCQVQCTVYVIDSPNNREICTIMYECRIYNDRYVPFLSLDSV